MGYKPDVHLFLQVLVLLLCPQMLPYHRLHLVFSHHHPLSLLIR